MTRTLARPRPALGIAVAAVALAAGLTAAPPAAARTLPGSTPATTITVLLKAPDQGGLDRLAKAQGLTHRQRVEALATLLPTARAHRRVLSDLASRGFDVTHESAWTIDAQAPSTTVASTFGRPGTSPSGARLGEMARAGAALPHVPTLIKPVVAAVLATSTGPSVVRPLDLCRIQCHDGTDFRNAYSSTSHVLRTGHDSHGALTVATLQFPRGGGWNDSDLTRYAQAADLPDPVASGQYKQIPVDGLTVQPATKKEGGADEEVDLDQETILSTAPLANQRAYFDSNTNKAGYADALSQVLADVTQGTGAVDGGDPKIAALSTSWGACEAEFSDGFAFGHDTIKAVDDILRSLTAAGVTVFAASGDDGIYDCGFPPSSTKTAVDFPASSPSVVGVGGTRLRTHGKRARNNGHNWTDTAWTCTSAEVCQGFKRRDTGGSGGGESKRFHLPRYQAVGIGHDPFRTSTGKKGNFGTQPRRLVPDIAGDGDPDTGFEVLTSDPADVPSCSINGDLPPCKPKFFAIGGTSLSAPAAAAMFTDMIAAHGATAGVGDIHSALYSAYAAHPHFFRDVRSGRNGRQKDVDHHASGKAAHDIPVNARKGYDTVTGLGTPLWPALAPYLFAPATPKPTGSLSLTRSAHHPVRVRVRWGSRQAHRGGLLAASDHVILRRKGKAKPVFRRHAAPPAGSHTFPAKPGATYVLTVATRDFAGKKSAAVAKRLKVRGTTRVVVRLLSR
jgi:kumamolisin